MRGLAEVLRGTPIAPTTRRRRLLPYLAAAGAVGLSVLAQVAWDPALGTLRAFTTLYPAVIFASWLGGVGPGLLALLLGLGSACRFSVPPTESLAVLGPVDLGAATVYVLTGLVLVGLCHAVQRSEHRAERRAEAAQAGEDRLRRVLDSKMIGIVFWDETGRISEANSAFLTSMGYTREQVTSGRMGWCDLVPPERLPLHERAVAEIRAQGASAPIESELKRADGTRLPILSAGAALGQEPLRGVSWVLDITARKRVEAARRREAGERARAEAEQGAARLRAISAGVVRVTTTFSLEKPLDVALLPIVDVARELIGAHEAAISTTIDEGWAQMVNAVSLSDKYAAWRGYEDAPDGTGIYAEVCRTNRAMRLTQAELEQHPLFRRFSKAADKHPPLRGWLALPLIGRDGKNLGVLQLSDRYEGEFTEEDESVVTQLAQLASVVIENHHLYARLAEGDRRKDEFLAMLGHELRNPLAAARNALSAARLDDARRGRALEIASRQVDRLGRLIDDLLDVARITQGRITLRKEPTDLAVIAERAVETTRPLLEERRHALQVAAATGGLHVEGDPARLEQVVVNLLTNAAKYTEAGGRVELRTDREGDEVVLAVRDSGIGIAPEMLGRVFDLFAQAERALDRTEGGLGIGLTIVQRLVDLHGGRVEARSEGLGRGAEFVVRLPAVPMPRVETAPATTEEPRRAIPARVLLVEDNPDAAESMTLLLEVLGYQIRVVPDGPTALTTAQADVPDLMLVDIGLPGMDGFEVVRRAKRDPILRATAVVALTGYGSIEDRRRALAAGFDHYLVKPVDLAALRLVIEGLAAAGR
jgi:PAS domain S-box-containing protein